MCVVCRGRFPQRELLRLQCINKELRKWSGSGRSFYLCETCRNSPKLYKILSKICRVERERVKKLLKEIN
ncbi:MAG: DUF448 domain-containing protein [Epsilonproteobacteria bacterium]|nr:DUF448 domain-containing protein [Campylobacterota bacterium]NPA89765.1 DUF448 domain-containing protein [Campylobacterota bacterium]